MQSAKAVIAGGRLVSMEGQHYVAKMSTTLLHQLGKANWVEPDRIHYIKRAVAMINQEEEIDSLTKEEIDQSKVNDLKTFTYHFREQLLR